MNKKEYDKEYLKVWRVKNKDKCNKYRAKWRNDNRWKEIISTKEWRIENQIKYKAQQKINNKMRLGKIKKQPCTICENKKGEKHHNDYSKPLEIVWLCRHCHMIIHKYQLVWFASLPSEEEIKEIVWNEIQVTLDKDTGLTNKGAEEIEEILANENIDNNIAKAISKRIRGEK